MGAHEGVFAAHEVEVAGPKQRVVIGLRMKGSSADFEPPAPDDVARLHRLAEKASRPGELCDNGTRQQTGRLPCAQIARRSASAGLA